MSACREIRGLLPVVPEDVSPDTYRLITEHLASCAACRKMQEDAVALDRAVSGIEVPDPGDGYWADFSVRVRGRVAAEDSREHGWWRRWFVYRPAFSWPATAVAAVIVLLVGRAMLPKGPSPSGPIIEQPVVADTAGSAPISEAGQAAVTPPAESPPAVVEAPPVTEQPAHEPIASTAEEVPPPKPVSNPPRPRSRGMQPDAVPEEELHPASSSREGTAADTDSRTRAIVILKGDTAKAGAYRGVPEGRELELAERPNAPFPTVDTVTVAQTQRQISSPVGQDYVGGRTQPPALNRGEFTPQDREYFTRQIKSLSHDLDRKKGHSRRETCRQLVDMYYQLAVNWHVPSDIEHAIEFMARARSILLEEDFPDVDAKTAALKSLLEE